MFADDTSLTAVGKTLSEAEEIANKELKMLQCMWLSSNKLSLNIAGFLAILLFLLFPTFLQLSYFSNFLLKIA
jgi:hypothetical protein